MNTESLSGVVDIISGIINGGPHAIMIILLLVIVGLIWDRKRLIDDVKKKDDKVEKIVNDYYEGNLTLAGALDSLKSVLYEIKSKI